MAAQQGITGQQALKQYGYTPQTSGYDQPLTSKQLSQLNAYISKSSGGGSSSSPVAGASGMPLDLNSIISKFQGYQAREGENPFSTILSQLNAAKVARQQAIESQFVGAKEEATQENQFRQAGAESLAARFSGQSFSSFAQGLVQKEIAASDKRMKDLESAKAQALNDLDSTYLEKISQMQIQEMARQDQLRQAAVSNALNYMNMQLGQQNFNTQNDPANLKFRALLEKYPTAGINMGDTPDQVAAKLQNIPMTPLERAQLQNELRLANGGGGNSGTPAKPFEFYEEASVLTSKLQQNQISWGNAWNYLKSKYPTMTNEQIDGALGKVATSAGATGGGAKPNATPKARPTTTRKPGYMEQIQAAADEQGYTNWLDQLSNMFR